MMRSEDRALSVGVVVLTMGGRDAELASLAASLAVPDDLAIDRVVVLNGGDADLPAGWRGVRSETNLGVPGGRNLGIAEVRGDVVIILDDDAIVRSQDLISRCIERFSEHPDLGALGFRIVVTGTNRSLRRWLPRIGSRGADKAGDVTAFPGGAHALRRSAVDDVGGYRAEFFYALEETELSWRLLDSGWRILFEPGIFIEHPEHAITRHEDAARRTARNKVWLARLLLPAPLAVLYIALWIGLLVYRFRDFIPAVLSGALSGLTALPGQREPMSWRTVWVMTKLGRPPII